jgi:hypothetical protein
MHLKQEILKLLILPTLKVSLVGSSNLGSNAIISMILVPGVGAPRREPHYPGRHLQSKAWADIARRVILMIIWDLTQYSINEVSMSVGRRGGQS